MRHRQTSGAGSTGARPGIAVFLLTALGAVLAFAVDGSAGAWAGYTVVTVAALVGGGTLWMQRGWLEQRSAEMARRRRADLAQAVEAELRHRAEADRLRAELEHEQQYSGLVQDQLTRARRQLEQERAARRAAERELDELTAVWEERTFESAEPAPQEEAPAQSEIRQSEISQPFRPFAGHVGGVSEAALAMAPVIEPTPAADAVLDLTAYDETLEFSVRDVRNGIA
jgi:hypothetical protein